jgi:hypothetical protein
MRHPQCGCTDTLSYRPLFPRSSPIRSSPILAMTLTAPAGRCYPSVSLIEVKLTVSPARAICHCLSVVGSIRSGVRSLLPNPNYEAKSEQIGRLPGQHGVAQDHRHPLLAGVCSQKLPCDARSNVTSSVHNLRWRKSFSSSLNDNSSLRFISIMLTTCLRAASSS